VRGLAAGASQTHRVAQPAAYHRTMQVEILASPSFSFASITIAPAAAVHVEAGAMAAYSDGVEVETKARGGMLAGLRRSVLGGESFFINTFRAPGGGQVSVAPALPGDMTMVRLDGSQPLLVQSGSWIASDPDIEVDTTWGGAKTFFSGEGLFLLKCTGSGDLLMSSYGAILTRTLGAGEGFTLDTGHVVAFDETVTYEVHKAGNWKTTVLGGEGLVTRFVGPGRLWLQTRNPSDFLGWLIPKLPTQRS
jgi:uncharacterized protein (TIGR00266 family)